MRKSFVRLIRNIPPSDRTVYLVMFGRYQSSVEGVFDDKGTARSIVRYLNKLNPSRDFGEPLYWLDIWECR